MSSVLIYVISDGSNLYYRTPENSAAFAYLSSIGKTVYTRPSQGESLEQILQTVAAVYVHHYIL